MGPRPIRGRVDVAWGSTRWSRYDGARACSVAANPATPPDLRDVRRPISTMFAKSANPTRRRTLGRSFMHFELFDRATHQYLTHEGLTMRCQPTAGRRTASLHIMKTRPLQATLAPASGG